MEDSVISSKVKSSAQDIVSNLQSVKCYRSDSVQGSIVDLLCPIVDTYTHRSTGRLGEIIDERIDKVDTQVEVSHTSGDRSSRTSTSLVRSLTSFVRTVARTSGSLASLVTWDNGNILKCIHNAAFPMLKPILTQISPLIIDRHIGTSLLS